MCGCQTDQTSNSNLPVSHHLHPPLIFKKTQEIICISLLLLLFLYNIVILRVSVFSLYLPHIMCTFAAPPLPLFPFFLTGFTGQRRGKCMNQSKVAHSQGEGKPESERNKGGEGVKKEKRWWWNWRKREKWGMGTHQLYKIMMSAFSGLGRLLV